MADITHTLIRTNIKGEPFIGKCIQCGIEGLTSIAIFEACDNPRGLTNDKVLLEIIEEKE